MLLKRTPCLAFTSLIAAAAFAAGCPSASIEPPALPGPPTALIAALAEGAQIELGETVVLDGSGSTLGANTEDLGLVLTYFWEVDTKPFGSEIVDESLVPPVVEGEEPPATNAIVAFTPDRVGIYGLTLQVSDGTRVSDLDHAVVEVGSGNNCPLADAGPDIVALTGVPATLDGTGTVDADLDEEGNPQPLQWFWKFSLVPNASTLTDAAIFSQGTANPVVVPDVPGTYILQLVVSDGICTTAPEYVTILASNGNGQPVADAGQSKLLTPCSPSEVTLDGTGSFDPEGSSLTYQWAFTQTPSGSLLTNAFIDGRFTATPSFNWDVPGLYTLSLTVDDGELDSDPDNVAVRAVPPLPNQAPVALAGENVVMNASASCTSGAYTGCSCSPCGSRSVVVSGDGSYDPDLDAVNFQWSVQSGVATLLGTESREVEITFPALSVACNQTNTSVVTMNLTVFDCRAASDDLVTVTFNCNG